MGESEYAPTPIGPKCPLNTASLKVLTSGIHLYNATITGSLLNNTTKIPITINLHTLKLISPSEKLSNGIHAPTNTNAAMLKSKSITDEKTDSSVCLLKNPSQANAAPQEKAARRSSVPRSEQEPMVSMAREREGCAF